MPRFLSCLALLVAISASAVAFAQEFVWRDQQGNAVPDSEFQKARGGFGALILLTEDEEFFERWNTPEQPRITTIDEAERGVPIHVVLIYAGARAGIDGKGDVTYDATVRKPDGSVYGHFEDIPVLKDRVAPGHVLQLAPAALGIVIEPEDPSGEYAVEIAIRDNVRNVELKLKQTFTVSD